MGSKTDKSSSVRKKTRRNLLFLNGHATPRFPALLELQNLRVSVVGVVRVAKVGLRALVPLHFLLFPLAIF